MDAIWKFMLGPLLSSAKHDEEAETRPGTIPSNLHFANPEKWGKKEHEAGIGEIKAHHHRLWLNLPVEIFLIKFLAEFSVFACGRVFARRLSENNFHEWRRSLGGLCCLPLANKATH